MATKPTKNDTEMTPITRSESAAKMLAYAAVHRFDPVPLREDSSSAYDHRLIGRNGGSFANSSDRVILCAPERPCGICRDRLNLTASV